MGVSVLVLGRSGSGKSTSLRNFRRGEIGVFNVAGKPLPFRGRQLKFDRPGYELIYQRLAENTMRAYVIDDANYLMAFQNFAKAKEVGYGKFTDMALAFERLLERANATNEDTIVYFLMHPDFDESGHMRPKTIGKMLDNQLCVEGMFPIVLVAECDEAGYRFATRTDGTTPAKTPMGMFDEPTIPNDLRMVDQRIREYWEMEPLTCAAKDKDNEDKESA